MPSYADAQLWAVVYQRLAWPHSQRLHELSAKHKLETLTADEQNELDYLLTLNDRAIFCAQKHSSCCKSRPMILLPILSVERNGIRFPRFTAVGHRTYRRALRVLSHSPGHCDRSGDRSCCA